MFFKRIEGSCELSQNNVKNETSILVKDFALLWKYYFFKRWFIPETERPFYLNFVVRVRGAKKEKKKKIERRVKKDKKEQDGLLLCYSFCERKPRVLAIVVTGLC